MFLYQYFIIFDGIQMEVFSQTDVGGQAKSAQ
jgi:hypothetical protein